MYNMAKATNYHTCLSEIKDSTGDKTCTVREKLIALSNLMDIARYFNGDWKYDITEEVVGYSIAYYKFVEKPHYSVCKLDTSVYTYYGSPVFKNKADEHPGLICSSIPDGKTQRRERRAKVIRKRKGRL